MCQDDGYDEFWRAAAERKRKQADEERDRKFSFGEAVRTRAVLEDASPDPVPMVAMATVPRGQAERAAHFIDHVLREKWALERRIRWFRFTIGILVGANLVLAWCLS